MNRLNGHCWICFRLTGYSRWRKRPFPRLFQRMARALIYEFYRALQFVAIVAYGGWFHAVIRDDMPSGYREFAPAGKKHMNWWPPMRYTGKVKRG